MERQKSSWNYVNDTIDMKADFIQLIKPFHPQLGAFTAKLSAAGVRINYFGTTSFETVKKLFGLGVEFPLVDNIVEMMREVEKIGVKPVDYIY